MSYNKRMLLVQCNGSLTLLSLYFRNFTVYTENSPRSNHNHHSLINSTLFLAHQALIRLTWYNPLLSLPHSVFVQVANSACPTFDTNTKWSNMVHTWTFLVALIGSYCFWRQTWIRTKEHRPDTPNTLIVVVFLGSSWDRSRKESRERVS